MTIYPAIDLMQGQCVRLYQGCYNQVTFYGNDPISIAQSFAKDGATGLHVVDLDGARQGISLNVELILRIKQETGLMIQTGGGIRSKKQIDNILNQGIDRV